MRIPRKCKVNEGNSDAWFYIEPYGITMAVTTDKGHGQTQIITLTRKQLERTIEVIEEYKTV